MRAALALYAIRFGGWLLAKTSGLEVAVALDLYEGPLYVATITRAYGA